MFKYCDRYCSLALVKVGFLTIQIFLELSSPLTLHVQFLSGLIVPLCLATPLIVPFCHPVLDGADFPFYLAL